MSVANYLTILRIAVSPFFLLIYLYPTYFGIAVPWVPYILLFLLTLCELTDASDGWVARRYNQVTELGKLLDPMADSIYRVSVFLTFTQAPVNLPLWVVFLFVYRDMGISTLRTVCALKGYTLAARPSGKLKAVFQAISMFAILLLMIPYTQGLLSGPDLSFWSAWITLPVAVYALFSGIEYLIAHRQSLTHILTCPAKSSP